MAAATSSRYTSLPDPTNFSDPSCSSFAVAVIGDLHLSNRPEELAQFHEARDQLKEILTQSADTARVIQLGDLGNYERGWPGSKACFSLARQFLDSFGLPIGLVMGNHDLEADEFETDEENLAAWHSAFGHRHYWSADLGPATFIGLSTTRFRSNPHSVHEVHIDDEQLHFLEGALETASNAGRPVIMITHAPILGSGLKAIQAVHVKNRCAWLNHSSDPKHFMKLVQKHPNIKLWFSGHFHLSQNYPDSVSIVGGTSYILTGVIGDHFSRDGHRHSRLIRGDAETFEVYTIDHDAGTKRLDVRCRWNDPGPAEYLVPQDELLCDSSSGWLCSEVVESSIDGVGESSKEGVKWFNAGPETMLTLQDDVLVEYDIATMAPIGAAFLNVPQGSVVRLVDGAGKEVDGVNTDGSAAVAVEIVDPEVNAVIMRTERNDAGCFYQIFQKNKWVARKMKEAAEAAAAAGVKA